MIREGSGFKRLLNRIELGLLGLQDGQQLLALVGVEPLKDCGQTVEELE